MTARDQYLPLGAKEKRNKMANPGSAKSGVKPSSPKYPNWIPNVLAKRRATRVRMKARRAGMS